MCVGLSSLGSKESILVIFLAFSPSSNTGENKRLHGVCVCVCERLCVCAALRNKQEVAQE